MTHSDPRLQQMAADATARGWKIHWEETNYRTELLVLLTVAPADPERPADSFFDRRAYGLGLGVAMAPTHQERPIVCWVWHDHGAPDLLVPWAEIREEDKLLWNYPPDRELEKFPVVRSLDEALALFDVAVARFVREMRQTLVEMGTPERVDGWCDLRPLAATA